MSSFSDILTNSLLTAAPSLVGGLLGTSAQTDANAAAAAEANAGSAAAANALSGGYDQSWDQQTGALKNVSNDNTDLYNALQPLYSAIPANLTNALQAGAGNYATDLTGAVNIAGGALRPAASSYGTALAGNAGTYGSALGSGADSYSGDLGAAARSSYSPYTAAGGTALSALQGIVGTSPGQLTPAQQLAQSNYIRQAGNSVAASGLRGAGRAGIASINNGLATMAAANTQTNQARQDQATQELLQAGELGTGQVYGADSASAGARLSAANQGAGAAYQAGNTGAQNEMSIEQMLAQAGLTANGQAAGARLSAANTGAAAGTTAAQNLINATQNYYAGKSGTDLATGQIDTNNIMGKANAAAGAAQGAGLTNSAMTAANGADWGGAIGTLGGIIAANNKSQMMPSTYTYNGGTTVPSI